MGCGAEDQKGCIRGCEEFRYLGVKIDKEDERENDTKRRTVEHTNK